MVKKLAGPEISKFGLTSFIYLFCNFQRFQDCLWCILRSLYGKFRLIDIFQIMGIGIAENMAVIQVRIFTPELRKPGHVLEFGAGKTAVRRNKSEICNEAVLSI